VRSISNRSHDSVFVSHRIYLLFVPIVPQFDEAPFSLRREDGKWGFEIQDSGKPMDGTDLLDEISQRIARRGKKTVTDAVLARAIGVAQPTLALWRAKQLTPRQVVNIMEKHTKKVKTQTIAQAVKPIVEFFNIDAVASKHGAKWELFSVSEVGGKAGKHPYLAGLQKRLKASHGIYVFHDSRGRAIYVGKAHRQTLWTEMNLAFNRDRGEVQNIKQIDHPSSKVAYKGTADGRRLIKKKPVALHKIASYISAAT
jgi:hypothetical protein